METEFRERVTQYAGREFIRKSILNIPGGAGVFDHVLGGRRYKSILEIGTYRGVSSAYMAQFCDMVTTIDLTVGKMEWDQQVFDRVRFWQALGISNIMLRLVDTNEQKAELIQSLHFDFAFVDGDHEGAAPRNDFEIVKRCGTVLFHDYSGSNGVTRLVNSLPRPEIEIFGIFALWTRRG